jgi:hypothetical protein
MRICDDRYSRDRLRLDLALRFIRHEARTQTIRSWTGLSDDRIRKLYRSYFDRSGCTVSRPRGRSPRQAFYFTRTPRLKQEAALLASLCSLLGALPERRPPRGAAQRAIEAPPPASPSRPRFAQGLALCEAYEAYRALVPAARISFEHLMCLFTALDRGDEIKLGVCPSCGALVVIERLGFRPVRCASCTSPADEDPRGATPP